MPLSTAKGPSWRNRSALSCHHHSPLSRWKVRFLAVSWAVTWVAVLDSPSALAMIVGPAGHGVKRGRTRWATPPSSSYISKDQDEFPPIDPDSIEWPAGPEKSSMLQYISDFLSKEMACSTLVNSTTSSSLAQQQHPSRFEKEDDVISMDTCTHLIAIPVDHCHQLVLELESVQRAILYHCPLLVQACLAPAVMRLPLLGVQARSFHSAAPLSPTVVTAKLRSLVQQVVQRRLLVPAGEVDPPLETTATDPEAISVEPLHRIQRSLATDHMVEVTDMASANAQGIRPLLMTFQSLEIDGTTPHTHHHTDPLEPFSSTYHDNHQVLLTVADPQHVGTRQLQQIVQDLQELILRETDWKVLLPWDPHPPVQVPQDQENMVLPSKAPPKFRPRVPFMRLPSNWEEVIRNHARSLVQGDGGQEPTKARTSSNRDERLFISSEQGGNGISPIFWGQWMDDTFAKDTRMREIGIYQRRRVTTDSDSRKIQSSGLESDFYLPAAMVPLPAGNAALSEMEAEFQEYQERRMREAEDRFTNEEKGVGPVTSPDDDDDQVFSKTLNRLAVMYDRGDMARDLKDLEDQNLVSNDLSGGTVGDEDEKQDVFWSKEEERPIEPRFLDDWTRQRIQQVVASRARVQAEQELATPKVKPDIADNEIFKSYKEGTLVPKGSTSEAASSRAIPPFPSTEHVVGFWRMVGSPTGFEAEEGDANKSDNLILRVDGSIAGGPILDQETRQKACGGSWVLTGNSPQTARLLIRLTIPPKKERVLVMEGELKLAAMSTNVPLATNTFSIPELGERAARAFADIEDLLFCSGDVWIEEIDSSQNRYQVGTFSIMKVSTPTDPSQFTITIPKNVRYFD